MNRRICWTRTEFRASAALVMGVLVTAPSHAEPSPPAAPAATPPAATATAPTAPASMPDRERRAKQLYEAGAQAYREARYRDAVSAFLAADALAPRPALSYNVARAYEKLGERAAAAAFYRHYLQRDPAAKNARFVRQRLDELESVQAAAPSGDLVPASQHEELRGRGTAPAGAAGSNDEGFKATDQAPNTFEPWSWIALGTGGATIAGAGVFELLRRNAEDRAKTAPTQLAYAEELDRVSDHQTTARVLAGVGGALLVTGGALLLIDVGRERAATTASVGCGTSTCLASVAGRF